MPDEGLYMDNCLTYHSDSGLVYRNSEGILYCSFPILRDESTQLIVFANASDDDNLVSIASVQVEVDTSTINASI